MACRVPLTYSAQPQQRTESLGARKIQGKMGTVKHGGERKGPENENLGVEEKHGIRTATSAHSNIHKQNFASFFFFTPKVSKSI